MVSSSMMMISPCLRYLIGIVIQLYVHVHRFSKVILKSIGIARHSYLATHFACISSMPPLLLLDFCRTINSPVANIKCIGVHTYRVSATVD